MKQHKKTCRPFKRLKEKIISHIRKNFFEVHFWTLVTLSFLFYCAISFVFGIFWHFIILFAVAMTIGCTSAVILMQHDKFFFGRIYEKNSVFALPFWKKAEDAISRNKTWDEYCGWRLGRVKGILLYTPLWICSLFSLLLFIVMGTIDHFQK